MSDSLLAGASELRGRLLAVLRGVMDELALRVTASAGDDLKGGKLAVSGWTNTSGIVSAFLSFLPSSDPRSESLDACLCISPIEGGLHLRADIAWSDGRLVADVMEVDIPRQSDEIALKDVQRAAVEATGQMATLLPSLIVNS